MKHSLLIGVDKHAAIFYAFWLTRSAS